MFDASTLILLARTELLQLFLDDSRVEALVSRAVMHEVLEGEREETPLIKELLQKKRIVVRRLKQNRLITRFMRDFSLHRGEAEAVHLAYDLGGFVATDDRNAMRLCRLLKVPFVTALAVLVRLHEKGSINRDLAVAKLQKLARIGRYSQDILRRAERKIRGGNHVDQDA